MTCMNRQRSRVKTSRVFSINRLFWHQIPIGCCIFGLSTGMASFLAEWETMDLKTLGSLSPMDPELRLYRPFRESRILRMAPSGQDSPMTFGPSAILRKTTWHWSCFSSILSEQRMPLGNKECNSPTSPSPGSWVPR